VGGDFMESPIGFVPLREAVDLVGLKIEGPGWRRLDEVDAANIAYDDDNLMGYYVDPHVDRVIKSIAEACERGEIFAAYRSVTGAADELPRAKWHSPAWRTYFATGMIDLDLPLLGDGNRPAGTLTARCTREVFVRRDDLDRFVAQILAPAAAPTPSPASEARIRAVITAVYDEADSTGRRPPNIKELPKAVALRLRGEGLEVSEKRIADIGGDPRFKNRRRPAGKTIASERKA
jgi:hypothetical protein